MGSFTCDQSNCYPGYTNWRPNVGQYNSDLPVEGTSWFRLSSDSGSGWEQVEQIHPHWQNLGICAPCRKGAQTPKTHILVSNTLHIYVSHILYSVRCSKQCLQYRFQIWNLKFGTSKFGFFITKVPNLGVPNFKSQIWSPKFQVQNLGPTLQAVTISKDRPRDHFLPRLEFSWWAVEAMVTRIVVGEQGFVIIVFCCW